MHCILSYLFNTTVLALLINIGASALTKQLQVNNPKALGPAQANLDRDIPRRAEYEKLWEEVKAS